MGYKQVHKLAYSGETYLPPLAINTSVGLQRKNIPHSNPHPSDPIRAIFLDLDGTLLTPEHEILPTTRGYVMEAQDNGIITIPVSGRPPASVMHYLNQMRIPNSIYIASHHRIQIGDRLLHHIPIPQETTKDSIDLYNSNKLDLSSLEGLADFLYFSGDRVVYINERHKQESKRLEEYKRRNPPEGSVPGLQYTKLLFDLPRKPSIEDYLASVNNSLPDKLIFLVDNPELAISLKKDLTDRIGQYLQVMISNGTYVELVSRDATKGNAVEWVLDKLQIDPKNAIAFGDGESDLTIQKIGVHVYLMGNAPQDLKDKARQMPNVTVIKWGPEQDGIGRIIARILKKPYK